MSDILDSLNDEQKEAVLYNNGPLLVLAGAGTGKTRVLTSKIAYILETGQAYPSEILAVTFTNKASREMQERVSNMLMKDVSSMWLGTFHAIGNKILRRHAELVGLTPDYTIIDPDDQNRLVKQIMLDLDVDIKDFPVKNYVNKINEWKDKGIGWSSISNLAIDFNYFPEIKDIYRIYQERCKKLNVCDFGDLLLYNVEIFRDNRDILNSYVEKFQYVLVDEYQDTNSIQHTWLKMISGVGIKDNINITCVGDDDQSIYGWRGAEIENILKFEKDFKPRPVSNRIFKNLIFKHINKLYRFNNISIKLQFLLQNPEKFQKYLTTSRISILSLSKFLKISRLFCKNCFLWKNSFGNGSTKIVRLERNYRSTSNILKVASSVISNNRDRHEKTLWTDSKNTGDKVYLNCFDRDKEEAYAISGEIMELVKDVQYKDIAILVRAGYQTRIFEEIFIGQSIPYKIVGGFKFYDRKEIKDCIAYLKLVKNQSDFLAFERIVNVPRRGVGTVTLSKILEEVKGRKVNILDVCEDLCVSGVIKGKTAENIIKFVCDIREWSKQLTEKDHVTLTRDIIYGSGYIDSLLADKTDESKSAIENINEFIRGLEEFQSLSEFLEYISLVNDKTNSSNDNSVNVMTIHSAKGLEFDTVFLPGWEEGIFPSPRSVDEKNGLEEERRLAYVAITRAKNRLTISYAKTRYEYGEIRTMQPSRFIRELPENNLNISDNIRFINEDEEYEEERVGRYNNYYKPKNYKKNYHFEEDDSGNVVVQQVKNIARRVVHPAFGEGVVIKNDGKKLTIAFKTVGVKTIIEDFVKFVE